MEYFVEQAATHSEAMEKVQRKYGQNAKVMHHKSVRIGGILGLFSREGVEVTGYFAKSAARRADSGLEEEKRKILGAAGFSAAGKTIARRESSGEVGNDGQKHGGSPGGDAPEKADKSDAGTLQTLLREVQGLRSRLETNNYGTERTGEQEHETLHRIRGLLQRNEFTEDYISGIVARLKREFALDELQDADLIERHVVDWIGESIRIVEHRPRRKGDVFILVGPTGVGKTTTIAKLAAMWGLDTDGKGSKDVRMITIDNYRIGARQQIETYGEIMGIPVHAAENYADLEKQIAVYRDVDLIFVDTIGKSPRDYVKIGEMKEQLEACGKGATVHLAVSATTKASDLESILQQFEPFGCSSVVATKLDETSRIGSLVSVLSLKRKPLCYLTDGQRVPLDIEPARIVKLLTKLDGFSIDRAHIEERFGAGAEAGSPARAG